MGALMQPTGNEVSREGLDDVRRSGRSARQQLAILRMLPVATTVGHTRKELADLTGFPLSSICGRCHELLDLKLIDVIDTQGKPSQQVLAITAKGLDWLLANDEGGQGDA